MYEVQYYHQPSPLQVCILACFPLLSWDLSETQNGLIYVIHWTEFIAFHGKLSSSLHLCFSHYLTSSDSFLLEEVQDIVQISARTLMPLLIITFSRNNFIFFPHHVNSLWTWRTSLGFGDFYQFLSPFFSLLPLLKIPTRILNARWIVSVITESQNHRIVGVGRALCGSSSPTPLPKQGHLQ